MADVARVIVDVRTRQLDRPFDYAVPPRLAGRIQPGHRVYVPFGRQFCQGYVIALVDSTEVVGGLKEVAAVLDELPLFPPVLLALAEFLQSRTVCTRLEALQAMVPGAYRARGVRRYKAALQTPSGTADGQIARQRDSDPWQAVQNRPHTLDELVRRFGPDILLQLERWLHSGAVTEVVEAEDAVRAKTVPTLRALCDAAGLRDAAAARLVRAPKQAALLSALSRCAPKVLRLSEVNVRKSDPAVQAVVRDSFAVLNEEEVYRSPVAAALSDVHPKRDLTPPQAAAVAAILDTLQAAQLPQTVAPAAGAQTAAENGLVLHGVTGSGKTEVYLQAIEAVLAASGGAIVLVPEIALTPQMVSRFTERFHKQVAVLHSSLSAGERRDEWLRVRRGEARVVVGARSAVFAPVHALRLMIVDEAHEATYKQEESPHYDAREVAAWRARVQGAAVVYGSATPSMELLHAAETGRLRWVSMPFRVHRQAMPAVTVVDMRDELRAGNHHLFSEPLRRGLEEAVGAGRQAMLFLNRRGFSAFVLCRQCGSAAQCPNCDISLTLHRNGGEQWLECHYCQFRQPVPELCEQCGEPAIRPFGVGTQQVEQIVRELWPAWRVLRMDVDTTRRKGAHRDGVAKVLDGQVDVLLGTQMIAKGLDFPNLSFVGVIAADTMLNVPDFRAAERTFSLLTQVIGRAGRTTEPGVTVIQTFRPDHYAVRAAANHDFSGFYPLETSFRQAFEYPPFCELTVFAANHEEESYARGAAARFERELRRSLPAQAAVVLPAAPSGIRRTKGQYRFQVVVKYSQWAQVRAALTTSFNTVSARMQPLGGHCSLDVNALRI